MELSGNYALLISMSMMSVLNSSPHPKPIVQGKAVKNNQFPFAVAFARRLEGSESFAVFCGGSLISQSSRSSWAISAAHCFINLPKNRSVHANIGGGDIHDAKWAKVLKILSASFNIYTFQNDIALVKIDSGLQQVVQRSEETPNDNVECMIYGYGSVSYQTNTVISNNLRYGRVSVISFEQCEDILGRVSAPARGLGQFCALGKNGVDACNGDSGSGLICRGRKGLFELVGVTSHGSGCGDGIAGVYEDVFHHNEWIDMILKQNKD